jgi:hypothetical protein
MIVKLNTGSVPVGVLTMLAIGCTNADHPMANCCGELTSMRKWLPSMQPSQIIMP